MFKNLLDKGKCGLGFHQGPWIYLEPDQCDQLQVCERCAAESRRSEHNWGEWTYPAGDACDLVRICQRCQERESQVAHDWGEWEYLDEGSCDQAQRCNRCGQWNDARQAGHQWGPWGYHPDYRSSIRACTRCGRQMGGFPRQLVRTGHMPGSKPEQIGSTELTLGSEPGLSPVERRQAIMEALWDVEDNAPGLEGPEVRAAAATAVGQLRQLLAGWGEDQDPLETARTWRFLGDAYFSQSGKKDQEALALAIEAYEQAEPYLEEAGDSLEWAKWRFNLANSQRLVERDGFFPYLEEAREGYTAVLPVFQAEMPQGVTSVENSLQTLEPMIKAQAMLLSAQEGIEQAGELAAALEAAGDDPEKLAAIQAEVQRLEADEDELLAQASSLGLEVSETGLQPGSEPDSQSLTDQGKERIIEAAQAGADDAALFGLLKEQYQAEIAAGRISPERQQLFDAIMSEAGDLVNNKAEELPEMMVRSAKAKDLLERMSDAVARPDALTGLEELQAGSRPGSRAAQLAGLNERLFKYIISETSKAHSGEEEWAMLQGLMTRYISSRNAIAELGTKAQDDEAAYKLEYENTRRLALDTRRYALREQLTLAAPAWPTPAASQNPNTVFYSGGPGPLALLEAICERQKLTLLPLEVKGDPAAERWKQLRQANIALFDLSAYRRPMPLAEAAAVAAVGYELGIALALGRPVVVVASEGQSMPFDVDVEPVRLAGDDGDEGRLVEAMNEAIYGLQRGGADSSVDETLRYARQEYAEHDMAYVRIALEQIDVSAGADPLKVRDILSAALGYLGPEAPQIIYPTWPGDYPTLYGRRCFHVTAFGPDWANETMALVRESCESAGEPIEYIRGDQVLDPDIIRSIWDEICRASHVVVDLTGLNINAVLELGMAHALGRNILIITQDDRPALYFRSIAKVRLHHYDLDDPAALQDLLATFFE